MWSFESLLYNKLNYNITDHHDTQVDFFGKTVTLNFTDAPEPEPEPEIDHIFIPITQNAVYVPLDN